MYKIPRPNSWPPQLDLTTLREAMSEVHGNLKQLPGFGKAAIAVNNAIKEIDKAERATSPKSTPKTAMEAKFMPRRLY